MAKLLWSVSVSLSFVPALHGGLILSETFSYTNGVLQIVSADKWVGHSGATNQVDVSDGVLHLTGSEGQDINASFTGQPYGAGLGDQLYTSFKVTFSRLPSNTGSYFAHFKDAGGGFRGRIWALTNGAAAGAFRLGISSGSGSAPSAVHPADLRIATEYLVVTRLILTNAVSSLWVDPVSEASPSVSTDAGAAIPISAYAFRQATGIGVMTVDDLLVGTTFGDVVGQAPAESKEPISIKPIHTPPTFAIQPQSINVLQGEDVTFTVEARGAEPLVYQWRVNDTEIAGATKPELVLTNVASPQSGDYRVVVSNGSGTATSQAANLTVIRPEPPLIVAQPANLKLKAGENATLTVAANGTPPLLYQWRFGQTDIPGAQMPALTLTNVTAGQAGPYQVTISNRAGSIISEAAVLTIETVAEVPATNLINAPKPPMLTLTNVLENLVRPGEAPTNTFYELVLRPGERLTTLVYASNPEAGELRLTLSTNGMPPSAAWTLSEPPGDGPAANLTFSPTASDAGTNYIFKTQAMAAGGTNEMTWSVYVPTDAEEQIVVTEFLANPASSKTAAHFNPLRRTEPLSSPGSNDEYVEIVNFGAHDVNLMNWTISDSVQVRHRFKEPFSLASSNVVVVYGGPAAAAPPASDIPALPASEYAFGLGLNNTGGDSILIRNANSNLISRIVYSEVSPNGSLTRFPDLNGGFVAHTSVTTNYFSPGWQFDGRPFKSPIVKGDAPLSLTLAFETPDTLTLRWTAQPGKTYTVLRSPTVHGPFVPMAMDLSFAEGSGQYVDRHWITRPISFYRISTP